MTDSTCRVEARRRTGRARLRPARARPPRGRSRRDRRPTRTTRTSACAPRRRTSPCTDEPAPTAAVRRSQRANAVAEGARAGRVRGRSTSALTAWCLRITPETWPQSSTSTSREHWRSTSPRRAFRWCRATCRRRSSTRRRRRGWPRPAAPALESTSTTTTPGTSTTEGTAERRQPTGTRRSTTRRTTTWRRATAWAGCCSADRRCSTSRSSGPRSTRHTSTPPPARPTTRRCQVWKRRCRTPPRIYTGSERDALGIPSSQLQLSPQQMTESVGFMPQLATAELRPTMTEQWLIVAKLRPVVEPWSRLAKTQKTHICALAA